MSGSSRFSIIIATVYHRCNKNLQEVADPNPDPNPNPNPPL